MIHAWRLAVLALALTGAARAVAQSSYSLQRGDRFRSAVVGSSVMSGSGPHIGLIRNRTVWLGALQWERVLLTARGIAVSSVVEVPVAAILPQRNPPDVECWWRLSTGARECSFVDRPNDPIRSIGLEPLELKVHVGPSRRVRGFASLGAGMVVFDRPAPVVAAGALNYSVNYALGADLALKRGAVVASLAWQYQHWSNGGMTRMNPGIDANLVVLSLKRRRR